MPTIYDAFINTYTINRYVGVNRSRNDSLITEIYNVNSPTEDYINLHIKYYKAYHNGTLGVSFKIYLDKTYIGDNVMTPDYRTIIIKDTEKIDELIEVSKNIAIHKIKRNAIYNNGLGLKLAVREYGKDF